MASNLAVSLLVALLAWRLPGAPSSAALWHLPDTINLQADLHEHELPGWLDRGSQVPRRALLGPPRSTADGPDGLFMALRCEGGQMAWRLTGSATWADNEPGKGHLRKRSYQNARRRAMQHGGTWYKNQWLTSTVLADPPTPPEWQPQMRRIQPRGKRLKILSWNARSLSMELWHEVQMYSKLHQFDLVFLQSTCWTFTSNWMANGCYIAHSGSTDDPHSGLLIMVNQSLGKADDISLGDPIAGRLQHLRVKTDKITLDLVNMYQHPWRPTMSHEENLNTRRAVWETLHESLTHLPFRNRLVLAGDFNTSIVSNAHVDANELKQMIQHHGLGSLLQSRNNQPTFYSQNGNSQIDFVFGRQCQLDSHAKTGIVDVQTPLASWREAPDHRPLICNNLGAGNLRTLALESNYEINSEHRQS